MSALQNSRRRHRHCLTLRTCWSRSSLIAKIPTHHACSSAQASKARGVAWLRFEFVLLRLCLDCLPRAATLSTKKLTIKAIERLPDTDHPSETATARTSTHCRFSKHAADFVSSKDRIRRLRQSPFQTFQLFAPQGRETNAIRPWKDLKKEQQRAAQLQARPPLYALLHFAPLSDGTSKAIQALTFGFSFLRVFSAHLT